MQAHTPGHYLLVVYVVVVLVELLQRIQHLLRVSMLRVRHPTARLYLVRVQAPVLQLDPLRKSISSAFPQRCPMSRACASSFLKLLHFPYNSRKFPTQNNFFHLSRYDKTQ